MLNLAELYKEKILDDKFYFLCKLGISIKNKYHLLDNNGPRATFLKDHEKVMKAHIGYELLKDNKKILVLSKNKRLLTEICDLFCILDIKELIKDFHRSERTMKLKNGSSIKLLTYGHESRGYETDILFIDEPREFRMEEYDSVKMCLFSDGSKLRVYGEDTGEQRWFR